MRSFLVTILAMVCLSMMGHTQVKSGVWGTLSMVHKTKEYDEAYGFEIEKVTVGAIPKMLAGSEIEVEGFIIPLEGKIKQNHFMLSYLPYNMCFFCGKAGPETAMQVFLADKKKVAFTENKIKVKGILSINENSDDGLLYTLNHGKVIE